MCGIVAIRDINGNPVNNAILDQFDKQRSRGTQGFGLFDGQFMNMFRATKEDKILKWLCKYDSNFIMFHHRFPTSTINVKRAAHPISTKKYFGKTEYVMVHNGHISNADELFEKHAPMGIEYYTLLNDMTFNDSECLLWDLALTLEGKQEKPTVKGYMAFVMLKLVKGKVETMYFGKDDSYSATLHLYRDKDTIELSSTGRGDMIEDNQLYSYNVKLNRLTHKHMQFTPATRSTFSSNYNGNYDRTTYSSHNDRWSGQYDDTKTEDLAVGDIIRNWNKNISDRVDDWLKNTKTGTYTNPDTGVVYVENNAGILVPRDDMYVEEEDDYAGLDLEYEYDPSCEPSRAEIQAVVISYLNDADGNFENAYVALENKYSDAIVINNRVTDNVREIMLLEAALEWLCADDDYIDEKSVSPLWRTLCQQKLLEA